jgi:hypothetical protein
LPSRRFDGRAGQHDLADALRENRGRHPGAVGRQRYLPVEGIHHNQLPVRRLPDRVVDAAPVGALVLGHGIHADGSDDTDGRKRRGAGEPAGARKRGETCTYEH